MQLAPSERSQKIILLWGLAFMAVFGLAWWLLLEMVPPPPATLSAADVAAYYTAHASNIKIGAVICSYVSACMVPLSLVMAFQLARIEKGQPVWSVLSLVSGSLMSMFLVFPPIIWGVIAFEPTRPVEITAALNQLANLTLVTTDQFFIFQMIGIWYLSMKADPNTLYNAFPRWLGWLTLWIAILFEVGALSYMFRTGPFAWDGVIVFWLPFASFFTWQIALYLSLWRALSQQQAAAESVR